MIHFMNHFIVDLDILFCIYSKRKKKKDRTRTNTRKVTIMNKYVAPLVEIVIN